MERIKDFFHDFSDIFLAIIIAGIMFAILALNLGNWFDDFSNTTLASGPVNTSNEQNNDTVDRASNNGDTDLEKKNNQSVENGTDRTETEESENSVSQNDEPQNNSGTDSDTNAIDREGQTSRETKKIIIPNGTFGAGVAKILKENGLISDINDFICAAESLNLSSRLRSGSFEIPTDATVEDIVKIIAGQKNMQ